MERSELHFELNNSTTQPDTQTGLMDPNRRASNPNIDPNRRPSNPLLSSSEQSSGGPLAAGPGDSSELIEQQQQLPQQLQQQQQQPQQQLDQGGQIFWSPQQQQQLQQLQQQQQQLQQQFQQQQHLMNQGGGQAASGPGHGGHPQQYQPYLRQFHALYPNIRNPEEKLPDQPHIQEVEKLQQLKLHQGPFSQFPAKLTKTGERITVEKPHIEEIEKLNNLHLHQGSVCQFPSKMHNPSERFADGPHVQEIDQLQNLHLHQGSVCQFPTKNPNPEDKLPDGNHIRELDELKNLHLKQGSVCQFPRGQVQPKVDYFHPPEEPLKESLPLAQVHHPDHCLPSLARKQQTYITHPSSGPAKLVVRGGSLGPGSPPTSPGGSRRGQSPVQWPPNNPNAPPKKGFHPEGGPKSFLWPPPKPQLYRSHQELPPSGQPGQQQQQQQQQQNAAAWNPSSNTQLTSAFAGFAPQRRQYNWPPPGIRGNLRKQSSLQDSVKSRSMLELDEVIVVTSPGTVASYRPPPWSQFYKPSYYTQS